MIVGVNGKGVHSVRDVLDAIGLEVGRRLELRVRRGEQELLLGLTTAPELPKR